MKKSSAALAWVVLFGVGMTVWGQVQKESVTVIREGPGGEVQIISKEQAAVKTAIAGTEAEATKKPDVRPQDDKPRKARVVVIPALIQQEQRRRIDRELNERYGVTDSGAIENPGLTSYLTDALVNARKFDMLERDELKSVIKELNFGESDYVDPQKCAKIGTMVGADYIVIPEIRYLETQREVKQVPYVGGNTVMLKCKIATAVRTVDVSTAKIVASKIREVEKRRRQRETDDADGLRLIVKDLISECFKEASMQEASAIVDAAYPIRVVSIDGDTVMLNRGQGAILKDEIIKVYATGEVMTDPDTKEALGYHESYVATIKVVEVDQKTSKAIVVEKVAPIQRLSVCHRVVTPTLEDPNLKKPEAAPKID